MSDTKIAIVLREDLQTWQKLNVTAFLTSGIISGNQALLGEPYEDGDNNQYSALLTHSTSDCFVSSSKRIDQHSIQRTYSRAMSRVAESNYQFIHGLVRVKPCFQPAMMQQIGQ